MAKTPPAVYILHGEDEFGIAQVVADLENRLGDTAAAAINVTHLDGRALLLDDLATAVYAMPFLAQRRLVIVLDPLAGLGSPATRQKFISLLDNVPPTTALLLIEHHVLTPYADRKKGRRHWLEDWASKAGDRVFVKAFEMPKGGALVRWILDRARACGGQFTTAAAQQLVALVGDDTRLIDQEIQKLLVYVNFRRPVEPDDVSSLTAYTRTADIFAMVDALGNRNGQEAVRLLHRLLSEQDAMSILGMVIRQFRLLLLAREVLDAGGGERAVARQVKIHPFVAGKITSQAQRFDLPALEAVYRQLLALDEAIKTGQVEADLALDTFVVALTA
jgi:DNA polymerase-3 subunit delta